MPPGESGVATRDQSVIPFVFEGKDERIKGPAKLTPPAEKKTLKKSRKNIEFRHEKAKVTNLQSEEGVDELVPQERENRAAAGE